MIGHLSTRFTPLAPCAACLASDMAGRPSQPGRGQRTEMPSVVGDLDKYEGAAVKSAVHKLG